MTLSLLVAAALAAVPPRDAEPQQPDAQAAAIEAACGLPAGSLAIGDGLATIKASPRIPDKAFTCLFAKLDEAGLKLGFFGGGFDPDAPLAEPLRHLAVGPQTAIDALGAAARGEKWEIVRTATASDGTAFLQIETPPGMSAAEAERLLKQIYAKEFGEFAFGWAPEPLAKPDPYGR